MCGASYNFDIDPYSGYGSPVRNQDKGILSHTSLTGTDGR